MVNDKDKNLESEKDQFRAALERIVNTSLTVDNVDGYAETALGQLIDLTTKIVTRYKYTEEFIGSYYQAPASSIEDSAFHYYGLVGIGDILANVIAIDNYIKKLDGVIYSSTAHVDKVILPPDIAQPIVAGEEAYAEPELKPKLKTLLVILGQSFGVDIADPEQIRITEGVVTPDMMRQASYRLVETPIIDRTTLICDEARNITYVFNNLELPKDITPAMLVNMTKKEIDELIISNPKIGIRVVESAKYVPNLIKALDDPTSSTTYKISEAEETDRLLMPKAPEGYLSIAGIAKTLNIDREAALGAKDSVRDQLGEVASYRFGGVFAPAYSPEQQEIIRAELERRGSLAEAAPEGYLSINGIAKALYIDRETALSAKDTVRDQLGELRTYKFGSSVTSGYSPEQQEIIRAELERRGILAEEAPEGYLSINGVAEVNSIGSAVTQKAIDSVRDQLGEVASYRFGGVFAPAYSPEQQEIIIAELERRGSLAEAAPEGYLSKYGIARALNIHKINVQKAIDSVRDQLGEVKNYKFSTRIVNGFSPEQQEIIIAELERRGSLAEAAPEGYLSAGGIARNYSVSLEIVHKAIDSVRDQLGEVKNYKFSTRIVNGFSPEQQEIIIDELERLGSLTDDAPEGYLSASGIAKANSISRIVVQKAIDSVKDQLGEVKTYKFYSKTVQAYSPEQQEKIIKIINSEQNKKRLTKLASRLIDN